MNVQNVDRKCSISALAVRDVLSEIITDMDSELIEIIGTNVWLRISAADLIDYFPKYKIGELISCLQELEQHSAIEIFPKTTKDRNTVLAITMDACKVSNVISYWKDCAADNESLNAQIDYIDHALVSIKKETIKEIRSADAMAVWIYFLSVGSSSVPSREIMKHLRMGEKRYSKAIDTLTKKGLLFIEREN